MVKAIKLSNMEEAYAINKFASSCDFDVYVHSLSKMIDAKSIMGLLTLIGNAKLNLVFPDNVSPEKVFKALKKQKIKLKEV